MSRERRPSAIRQLGDQTDDKEFKKLMREYENSKPKKAVPATEIKVKVGEGEKKSVHSSKLTAKAGKETKGKGKHASHHAVAITPAARLQEELEEKHIARGRDRKSKYSKPRKILPEGAVELPDIETAIKRGVKESSTLLLDWASPKAKMIGFLCKVYWDGEDTWFYARILNYDSFYDRHYIYYLEDSTAEWIDLAAEIVLVGEELVFARLNPGGAPWAAQRYWISDKAKSVCHNFPGFHKGGEYVEYLSDQKNKEYAFLQKKCLDPMQDKFLPSKQSAAFKKSMKAAEHERQAIDDVLEAVQGAIRESVFNVLSGEQWVGYRVRASTHRILQPGERRHDARETGGSAYSTGTIRCYRPSSNEHLVVFDDPLLQPQWVVCQKSSIDVLLGEEGAKVTADGTEAPMEDIAASSEFPLTVSKGQMVDYTEQCSCVLCTGALVQGTFRRCTKCGLKCHSYCISEDTPTAAVAESSSSVSHYWPASTALPWTCWNCVECFGCQTSSWEKSLLPWNARRVEPDGPDLDMQVCGDCLYRYKHVKDFCPSCFKLYAVDDSMLPLYGATLCVPSASASGADGTVTTTVPIFTPEDPMTAAAPEATASSFPTAEGSSMDVEPPLKDGSAGIADGGAKVEAEAKMEPMDVEVGSAVESKTSEEAPNGDADLTSDVAAAATVNGEVEQPASAETTAVTVAPSAPKPFVDETSLAEENMVECNECSRWVHAHCEGIDKAQYDAMTLGTHPIWGDEYLCPLCRVKISKAIIAKMERQDVTGMFAEPVTDKVARNYYDVIRNPMDMATMGSKAARGLYKSLQALRQDFELMCLNAMVFNTNGDEYWREAQRFFLEVQQMFKNQKRKSHASAYGFEAEQLIAQHNEELEAAKASKAKKRKATSSSLSSGAAGGASGSNANGTASAFDAELAKLGGDPSRGAAGSSKRSKVSSEFGTSSVTSEVLSESNNTDMIETASLSNGQSHDLSGAQLPKSNPTPPEKNLFLNENVLVPVDLAPSPDPSSFLPCTVVSHSIEEAYFLMCQEACLVCGSSGRAELMLYCVDCGEAVHSFCSDAPLSLMSEEARAGWRCMNCKICKCCNVGSENEALGKLLYCEGCDEAFHSKCVTPVVQTIPENSWFCGGCVKCRTCESDHTAVRDSSNSKTAPWGFDLSQCYPCAIREVITKAQAEAVQRARNLPSNCNVCYQPVCAPSVMCTACGRHSHVTCNPATALPVMSNDLENYRDFLCKVCVNQFLPACTSHIGSGEAATALLVAVARIQRVRRAQRQAMQAQSIKALAAERRVVFDSYRLVFRAVIHLATVRLRWFSEATGIVKSPTASAGPPTVKMFPNYLSGRSLRFLSFYKRRLEGSAESLRIRRERLLMGLDQETGLEMSSERLVRVASLAAAFLQCTGPDMNMFVSRAQEFVPTISFLEGLYGSAQNAELAQESILKFIASIGDIGKHSVKASSSGGGSSSVASTACSASNNGSMSDVTSVRPEGCALPTPVNVTAPSVAPSATDQSQFNHIVSHFLEYCIDNLSRSPIGLDTSDVPVSTNFCSGFAMYNSSSDPSSSAQPVVAAVPWKPGNIMSVPLLSRRNATQNIMHSPQRAAGQYLPSDLQQSTASVVPAESSRQQQGRGGRGGPIVSGTGGSGGAAFAGAGLPTTVDLRHGDGYYAKKARMCSLVRREPEVPSKSTVEDLLARPDILAIHTSSEQARQKEAADIAQRSKRAQAGLEYLTAVAVVDEIIVKIEKRFGTGSKASKAGAAQRGAFINGSSSLTVAKSEPDLQSAADDAVMCISCDSFDPSLYTFAATPARGMFGWKMLGDTVGPGADRPWQDPRSCCLCLDGKEDEMVGRLLPCFDGYFVHVNCLRWSPEVTEVDGYLKNAVAGREKGLRTSCYYCSRKGATVTCRKKCRRAFHVRCAIACNCAMMETKPARCDGMAHEIQTYTLCPEHIFTVRDNPQSQELWTPHDPTRSLLIEENHDANFTAELLAQRRSDKAVRMGAVTILSVGRPLPTNASFYNERYVYPHRFRSTRIYWSAVRPFERTLYTFEIFLESDFDTLDASRLEYIRSMLEKSDTTSASAHSSSNGSNRGPTEGDDRAERPIFRIMAMDDPSRPIFSYSAAQAFKAVVQRVHDCNMQYSKVFARCILNRQHNETYGFTPHQFFGYGLPFVRKAIEMLPETLPMMVSFNREEPKVVYRPVYRLPTVDAVIGLQQQLLRALEGSATSINGCVRADGYGQGEKRFAGKRITRILTKVTDVGEPAKNKGELNQYELRDDEDENKRVNEALKARYIDMTAAYLINPYAKLDVRKSSIHGWGLFAKTNFERNDIIVEYIGQKIRQVIADRREVQYEEEGVGSCYLFRLDKEDIIDATRRGGMARFINHCCEPNAYARVISLNLKAATAADDFLEDKHIIIMAARDIQEGEEITYDYKFPIEDSKLKCYCGAACCGGYMN